ncbi:MAG: RNA helicase [Comamonadaceae bacterium]|nr:MAG: RNA helicase [Comamonadaceae bacterium]
MSNTWWKDESELKKEQSDLLDLDLSTSILIKGPPGSGKTNLLLLKANHLHLGDKPNLYVIVYGKVLKQFIQVGGAQYKFPSSKISTHSRLFLHLLYEYDGSFDSTGLSILEVRKAIATRLEELIASGKIGKIYDALLIDEAQDYFPAEIRIFRALADVLIAAADTRQKVYAVDDCSEALEFSVSDVYELKHHYRNGMEICRLADGIMKGNPDHVPLVTHTSYDEKSNKSKVQPFANLSVVQQAAAMVDQIVNQRTAYPYEIIGIMCPRKEELAILYVELSKTVLADELTRCSEDDFDPSKHIWFSTIASAKGLEFRTAHLAGLDFLSNTGSAQKRLAFTAVTRAKTTLSLYYEIKIPGYLESALRSIAPEKTAITKANIFGKE